jgi:hypothetical protein
VATGSDHNHVPLTNIPKVGLQVSVKSRRLGLHHLRQEHLPNEYQGGGETVKVPLTVAIWVLCQPANRPALSRGLGYPVPRNSLFFQTPAGRHLCALLAHQHNPIQPQWGGFPHIHYGYSPSLMGL